MLSCCPYSLFPGSLEIFSSLFLVDLFAPFSALISTPLKPTLVKSNSKNCVRLVQLCRRDTTVCFIYYYVLNTVTLCYPVKWILYTLFFCYGTRNWQQSKIMTTFNMFANQRAKRRSGAPTMQIFPSVPHFRFKREK